MLTSSPKIRLVGEHAHTKISRARGALLNAALIQELLGIPSYSHRVRSADGSVMSVRAQQDGAHQIDIRSSSSDYSSTIPSGFCFCIKGAIWSGSEYQQITAYIAKVDGSIRGHTSRKKAKNPIGGEWRVIGFYNHATMQEFIPIEEPVKRGFRGIGMESGRLYSMDCFYMTDQLDADYYTPTTTYIMPKGRATYSTFSANYVLEQRAKSPLYYFQHDGDRPFLWKTSTQGVCLSPEPLPDPVAPSISSPISVFGHVCNFEFSGKAFSIYRFSGDAGSEDVGVIIVYGNGPLAQVEQEHILYSDTTPFDYARWTQTESVLYNAFATSVSQDGSQVVIHRPERTTLDFDFGTEQLEQGEPSPFNVLAVPNYLFSPGIPYTQIPPLYAETQGLHNNVGHFYDSLTLSVDASGEIIVSASSNISSISFSNISNIVGTYESDGFQYGNSHYTSDVVASITVTGYIPHIEANTIKFTSINNERSWTQKIQGKRVSKSPFSRDDVRYEVESSWVTASKNISIIGYVNISHSSYFGLCITYGEVASFEQIDSCSRGAVHIDALATYQADAAGCKEVMSSHVSSFPGVVYEVVPYHNAITCQAWNAATYITSDTLSVPTLFINNGIFNSAEYEFTGVYYDFSIGVEGLTSRIKPDALINKHINLGLCDPVFGVFDVTHVGGIKRGNDSCGNNDLPENYVAQSIVVQGNEFLLAQHFAGEPAYVADGWRNRRNSGQIGRSHNTLGMCGADGRYYSFMNVFYGDENDHWWGSSVEQLLNGEPYAGVSYSGYTHEYGSSKSSVCVMWQPVLNGDINREIPYINTVGLYGGKAAIVDGDTGDVFDVATMLAPFSPSLSRSGGYTRAVHGMYINNGGKPVHNRFLDKNFSGSLEFPEGVLQGLWCSDITVCHIPKSLRHKDFELIQKAT